MTELFRTSTFRLALFYFGVFATSVLAVLAFIYWQTVVYADQQTDETIEAEITGLAEQYRDRGLSGLVSVIEQRSDPPRSGSMLYLLTDRNQAPLAGNLRSWPDVTVGPDGWMRFQTGQGAQRHTAQATSFLLAGGYQLLVGRDLAERGQFSDRIVDTLIWSALLTLGLEFGGGLLMSRRVLARIEAINRASDQVMAGDLGHRIPLRGADDEFERLAQNLNAMLERIEQLMAGMRQVGDNIAHDLRTPLGRLRSRLEMALLDPAATPERYGAILQDAIDDADQLLATFTALLDIADAEAGSGRADMAPLDIAALVRTLGDFYEPAAEEQGLALVLDAPLEPIAILGNRHLLGRALANLIENALKYTPSPGQVTVSATRAADNAEIVVADSGPGIPPQSRETVLDQFVRLEHSRTTPGNGLGLSLVRAVVTLHGGSVRLEDNAPGLHVSVTLPLVSQASVEPHTKDGGDYTTSLDSASPRQ